jgi:cytidyltransferase-like protein
MERVVTVSGGFDPVHIGHIRLFKEARALGDKLIVIVNNDNWLKTKKGQAFMPEEERAAILEAFPFVDGTLITSHVPDDPDRSVSRELQILKPAIFANGGDRLEDTTPEVSVCNELGIELRFNVGFGGKVQSSSWLVDRIRKNP